MAKAQQVAARFVTEVAPPQLVSIVRRRQQHRGAARSVLDTIAEDDREMQLSSAYGDQYLLQATTAAAADAMALAPSPKRPAGGARRAGGFMRELSGCFSSSSVVHAQTAAATGWGRVGSSTKQGTAGERSMRTARSRCMEIN